MGRIRTVAVVAVVIAVISGCQDDENKRLAEMAERNVERQSAQEARNTELQHQVAEGTRRLVAADSAAREKIVELHRDVQAERSAFDQQRDLLENERREIASARNRDPIIAEAIQAVGLLLVCLVPLLIAVQILRRAVEPDENAAIAELLLNELTGEEPKLVRLENPKVISDDATKVGRLVDRSDHHS